MEKPQDGGSSSSSSAGRKSFASIWTTKSTASDPADAPRPARSEDTVPQGRSERTNGRAESHSATPRKRNFKCLLDPQISSPADRGSAKAKYRFDGVTVGCPSDSLPRLATNLEQQDTDTGAIEVNDPRDGREYARRLSRNRKKLRSELRICPATSRLVAKLGPVAATAIVVSNLSLLSTSSEIGGFFRSYGSIGQLDLRVNPSTGASLGICRILFRKPGEGADVAARAARQAQSKCDQQKFGGRLIKVQLDEDGTLCEDLAQAAIAQQAKEEEARRRAIQPLPVGPSRSRGRDDGPEAESRSDSTPRDGRVNGSTAASIETAGDTGRDGARERSRRNSPGADRSAPGPAARRTTRLARTEVAERLGDRAYLFLDREDLPFSRCSPVELERHFAGRGIYEIFTDDNGFYITFNDEYLADRCQRKLDRSTYMGYRLRLEYHRAKRRSSTTKTSAAPPSAPKADAGPQKEAGSAFKRTFKPVDVVATASNQIVRELQEAFLRDLKSRVIGPTLLEFLDPTRFAASRADAPHVLAGNGQVSSPLDRSVTGAAQSTGERKLVDVIGRFKKKSTNAKTAEVKVKAVRRMNGRLDHQALYGDSSDESDADEQRSSDRRSERMSSVAPSITSEKPEATNGHRILPRNVREEVATEVKKEPAPDSSVEYITAPLPLPQKRKRDLDASSDVSSLVSDIATNSRPDSKSSRGGRRREVDFSSSEDSSEDAPPVVAAPLPPKKPAAAKKKKAVKPKVEPIIDVKPVPPRDADEEMPDVAADAEVKEAEAEDDLEDQLVDTCPVDEADVVLDLQGIQGTIQDDEDLDLLREILRDVESTQQIGNLDLWAWQHKATRSKLDDDEATSRAETPTTYNRTNSTGSARTQGLYKIPDIEKSFYLPNRNRAVVSESTGASALSSSRMNRANNRRAAAGIEAQRATLETQSDMLRFSALKSRKKNLKFARSAIHDWGLYALEPIERGDMVIEYVGEIIRQRVADHREKRYERQGIGSSYLFRVDEDTVIDATKCGNVARFINHSCDPSCTAKIISVNGQKKIVIYSSRDIGVGEEITYDYKFPLEDVKIPCLCGSAICRKYLN